jgi:hypothetical protein
MATKIAALGEPTPKRKQVVLVFRHVEDVMQMDSVSFTIECHIDINITLSFCISLQASNTGNWGIFDSFKCLKDIMAIHNM